MSKTKNSRKIKKCFSILNETIAKLETLANHNFSSMSRLLDVLVMEAFEKMEREKNV